MPQFEKPTQAQLLNRFLTPVPNHDQCKRYEQIRAAILYTSSEIVALTPVSPEQSRALNALDEALFLALAAIARNEPIPDPTPKV